MSNHIAAKFFDVSYSSIPKFSDFLDNLIASLRKEYPTQTIKDLHTIKIPLNDGIPSGGQQVSGKELLLIDAEGKYGLKIGNAGLSMSVDGYTEYNEMISRFEVICNSVKEVLDISHFSQVTIRNINLFKAKGSGFEDIKERDIWGKQDFESLKELQFSCSGAATRHEYFSENKTLHVVSSIVLEGRSYIPQEEWDIWDFRGQIPAVDSEAKLLIELVGAHHQYSLNEPHKKNKLSPFDWEIIKEQLKESHHLVNKIYNDITS